MQNPQGQIISVNSDRSGVKAVVAVDNVVVCERCESGKGCGAGLLGSNSGGRRIEAVVAADLEVKNGDLVSVVLEPRNILRAAMIVYGYPLSGAVLATIAGFGMGLGDVGGSAAALFGLIAGILAARIRLKNTRCLRDFTPMVVDKLSPVQG